MSSITAERNYQDFGWGNITLIASIALVLTFLVVRQSPVQYAQTNSNDSKLALSSQFAQLISSGAASPDNSSNSALALNNNAGQVLGASTYNKDFVSQLNISVQITADNSPLALQQYSQQISVLFKADHPATGSAQPEVKFLNDIKLLAVPDALADYQRLLIGYYGINYVKDLGQGDSSTTQSIATLKTELDLARTNFNQNYSLRLP